jgi:hypothetical protein
MGTAMLIVLSSSMNLSANLASPIQALVTDPWVV